MQDKTPEQLRAVVEQKLNAFKACFGVYPNPADLNRVCHDIAFERQAKWIRDNLHDKDFTLSDVKNIPRVSNEYLDTFRDKVSGRPKKHPEL